MKDNQNLLIILIVLVTLNLATNVFTFFKINNDLSDEKISRIVKSAILESQKESSKYFLDLLGLTPEKIKENTLKQNISSVKVNMHTFQTIVETYAVDWGGLYSKDLSGLVSEAVDKSYWQNIVNPFTGKMGLNESCINAKDYNSTYNKLPYKGMVIYENNSEYQTSYKIWGTDENGDIIENFMLSNN